MIASRAQGLGALGAAVLLAACAPESGGPHSTTTATATPTAIAAMCRLPVVVRRFDQATRKWSPDRTGFLTYPNGRFVAADGTGVRYDAGRDRWLPAGQPTPDGTGYVYGDDAGNIHQVVLDSGRDTVIVTGKWSPLGFIGDRLYLEELRPTPPSAFGGGGYGPGRVARTSLSGGQPTLVSQQVGFWSLSSLGGWTMDRADGDRLAPPDRVLHLDLGTGSVEPWLSGVTYASLAGFDAGGHPFLLIERESVRVLLLAGKADAREVYSGPSATGRPQGPTLIDGVRVWFSGFSVTETFEAPVWLYQPGVGLSPSVGVPGAQVSVAGGCA